MSPSLHGAGRVLLASHFLVMRGFKLHGYDRFELLPVSLSAPGPEQCAILTSKMGMNKYQLWELSTAQLII